MDHDVLVLPSDVGAPDLLQSDVFIVLGEDPKATLADRGIAQRRGHVRVILPLPGFCTLALRVEQHVGLDVVLCEANIAIR